MCVVVFDYTAWSARYPALAAVTPQATAQAMFNDASLTLLSNTDNSTVSDCNIRAAMFNMLVAHLAILAQRDAAGGVNGGLVGRIDDATEGSVHVGVADYGAAKGSEYFTQTEPGAAFWQAFRPYRQGRYQPGPRPFQIRGPFFGGGYPGRY